ncbi:MAG: ANTAR domain-containing protein [Oscillospiraceae bacterium]|nr:ANTAR domain-containing protein [Oscillospiraceae bacterium]
MDGALIVSSAERGTELLTELLTAAGFHQIAALRSGGEARRTLLEREFDLVIINSPLIDESGEGLARQIATQGVSQVMLVVKGEFFDAISANCEDDGVLTIAKPLNKNVFWSGLKLARAAQNRLRRAQAENVKLERKIEEIRIIDRAKCILISNADMSEEDAHRYIEKQAMDLRSTKRDIAEDILRTYELP